MIKEDYCSYEVSKLLKEKGFNEDCKAYYKESKFCWVWNDGCSRNTDNSKYVSCPSQALAMKWLREEHKLFIVIDPEYFEAGRIIAYSFAVWCGDNYKYNFKDSPTYEEAVEAALKYCLTELI